MYIVRVGNSYIYKVEYSVYMQGDVCTLIYDKKDAYIFTRQQAQHYADVYEGEIEKVISS